MPGEDDEHPVTASVIVPARDRFVMSKGHCTGAFYSALAGAGYMLAYPAWFLLWKGGVVAEPIHWVLFVGFWLLLAGGTIFYRFR